VSVSQSLAEAIRSPAARVAAARGGSTDRPFKPKFCRTRSCNLKFAHDGRCVGVSSRSQLLEVKSKPRHQYGGTPTYRSTVTTSPRVLPKPGAHEHMAVIRSRRASQEGHKTAKQRRGAHAYARVLSTSRATPKHEEPQQ
jgi:hypothetical protein